MPDQQLTKSLPGRFVIAVTVGGVIGLGILRGPGEIANVVSQPVIYLGLWLLAGLFILLSASVVAELIGMTPRSGGYYPLIRHAYGPYPGFVIGWVDWLTYAASIALKSIVIIEFTALLFPAAAEHVAPLAIAVTTFFALVQLRGISLGSMIQQTAAAIIGLGIVAMSLLLFFADSPDLESNATAPQESSLNDWSLVIATIIYTFDGWLYASYFSGEIKDGARAIARGCIKGVVVVTALYMLLNLALVKSVGLAEIAGKDLALAYALEIAVHPAASTAVIVAAILVMLSHQNLFFLGGPRILHALAVDGFMAKKASGVSSGGNPIFAVLLTWLVATILLLLGGIEFLLLLSVFFYIPLYLAVIVGVFILRRREPDSPRPYRAWGHPLSTIVCIVGWTLITLFQSYVERETALYALAMVAVSWPVFRYLSARADN